MEKNKKNKGRGKHARPRLRDNHASDVPPRAAERCQASVTGIWKDAIHHIAWHLNLPALCQHGQTTFDLPLSAAPHGVSHLQEGEPRNTWRLVDEWPLISLSLGDQKQPDVLRTGSQSRDFFCFGVEREDRSQNGLFLGGWFYNITHVQMVCKQHTRNTYGVYRQYEMHVL